MQNPKNYADDEARLSDNAGRGDLNNELHCPVEGAALTAALAIDGARVHK